MDYSIINAAPCHAEQLELIEQQCFSLPWSRAFLLSQLPDEQHVFIVATMEEKVLGYVGMMHVLDEGYISNVAVAPQYRRNGIADALIGELICRCKALGLAFVTLEVRQSNAPAIALYEKHGFSPVGRRKNYYDFPKEDAILMTKFFDNQEA